MGRAPDSSLSAAPMASGSADSQESSFFDACGTPWRTVGSFEESSTGRVAAESDASTAAIALATKPMERKAKDTGSGTLKGAEPNKNAAPEGRAEQRQTRTRGGTDGLLGSVASRRFGV